MGIFDLFKKPFGDVHDAVKSYERFHNRIYDTINVYEQTTKAKSEETEVLLLVGIKENCILLKESGLDLDNVILNHIKHGSDVKKLSQFATQLQKHSVVPVSSELLLNKEIEITIFPTVSSKDVINYAKNMLSYYKDYNNTLRKVEELKTILNSNLEEKLNLSMFETMLKINEQNLVLFKSAFAKEARTTNRLLEKNLCFLSLPHELNEETIRLHAYLRKLVDFEIISGKQVFKKFTDSIPNVLTNYVEELGYFELNEEQIQVLSELKKKSA